MRISLIAKYKKNAVFPATGFCMHRIVNMLSQISIFDLLQEASKKFKACSLTSIQWFNECYIIGPKVALDKNTYVERNKKASGVEMVFNFFVCVFEPEN